MLKAFTAVAVLIMSVVMGLETFNQRTTVIVCAISFGVALASYGELSLYGLLCSQRWWIIDIVDPVKQQSWRIHVPILWVRLYCSLAPFLSCLFFDDVFT